MNLTLQFLGVVGSPFTPEHEFVQSKEQALEFYKYAVKNKIALLYLEVLKKQRRLSDLELTCKYEEEHSKRREQMITINSIARKLNSFKSSYAIFKSIMPYPAVPNDVDIVYFSSAKKYHKDLDMLLKNGYEKPSGGSGPFTTMIHDTRSGSHPDESKKDVYDIDLYRKTAISHLVYLDKRKFAKYITEINISGDEIKTMIPQAELLFSIIHSIIAEQIFTLFIYFATLYHFKKMDSKEIDEFIHIVKENNAIFSVKSHFSLVAQLHKVAHGFIPQKLDKVLAELGINEYEMKNLLKNGFNMPYLYSWMVLIRSLLEKTKEKEFMDSVFNLLLNMLNPKFAVYVIRSLIWRRKRDTY